MDTKDTVDTTVDSPLDTTLGKCRLFTGGVWGGFSLFEIGGRSFPRAVDLSTQLDLSKVFKSKSVVFAQFWPDFENSTSGWSKTLKRGGRGFPRAAERASGKSV